MKKAFTLAEILIVLAVIGVITAILLPAARHVTPDENALKFKKAHNTLLTVIRELVNSDEYYSNGDLAYRADGTRIDGTHTGDNTYFCKTISEVISTKDIDCDVTVSDNTSYTWIYTFEKEGEDKEVADERCKTLLPRDDISKITTADNVTYYFSYIPFGTTNWGAGGGSIYSDAFHHPWFHPDGFYGLAKVFCIDIDGLNQGEDPFGYGIRVDGKVIVGPKAQEWLQKSIQNKD